MLSAYLSLTMLHAYLRGYLFSILKHLILFGFSMFPLTYLSLSSDIVLWDCLGQLITTIYDKFI